MRRDARFDAPPYRTVEGDDLNAEIVFEIKDGGLVTEARSQLTAECDDGRLPSMAGGILSSRKRVWPLLLTRLLCCDRDRDVAGGTGFAGIVRRLRAAG